MWVQTKGTSIWYWSLPQQEKRKEEREKMGKEIKKMCLTEKRGSLTPSPWILRRYEIWNSPHRKTNYNTDFFFVCVCFSVDKQYEDTVNLISVCAETCIHFPSIWTATQEQDWGFWSTSRTSFDPSRLLMASDLYIQSSDLHVRDIHTSKLLLQIIVIAISY